MDHEAGRKKISLATVEWSCLFSLMLLVQHNVQTDSQKSMPISAAIRTLEQMFVQSVCPFQYCQHVGPTSVNGSERITAGMRSDID